MVEESARNPEVGDKRIFSDARAAVLELSGGLSLDYDLEKLGELGLNLTGISDEERAEHIMITVAEIARVNAQNGGDDEILPMVEPVVNTLEVILDTAKDASAESSLVRLKQVLGSGGKDHGRPMKGNTSTSAGLAVMVSACIG